MERYGFVYIWFDRKHKRYYIGCHWGREDDGYICSSRWMRKAYKRRSEDFGKRRTIAKVYTNIKDLLKEEYKWLSLIKDEELGKRYYNLTNHQNDHWSADGVKKQSIAEKIAIKTKQQWANQEYREIMSHKDHPGWGQWSNGWTEESRRKASLAKLGKPTWMKGKKHTEEAKEKNRIAHLKKNKK